MFPFVFQQQIYLSLGMCKILISKQFLFALEMFVAFTLYSELMLQQTLAIVCSSFCLSCVLLFLCDVFFVTYIFLSCTLLLCIQGHTLSNFIYVDYIFIYLFLFVLDLSLSSTVLKLHKNGHLSSTNPFCASIQWAISLLKTKIEGSFGPSYLNFCCDFLNFRT